MTLTALLVAQTVLTLHPSTEAPLRFGFPIGERQLKRGLRLVGSPGARLQWRRLQRRADPVTQRVWVELCVCGAGKSARVVAGGDGPCDEDGGACAQRTVSADTEQGADGRELDVVRWRWHTGEMDELRRLRFTSTQEYGDEIYSAGETQSTGLRPERFTAAGISTKQWRKAGVLPPGGALGRTFRRRLLEMLPRLVELVHPRDRGDYRRSREVMTNLEFDTALAFARIGLVEGRPELLARAQRSAVHTVDHDLDARTSLLFRHGKSHRSAPPDLGHTWLSGVLLVACLSADDHLILAAGRIAHGIANHPAVGEGRGDLVREVGWPLLEMEAWLRFADDPPVAVACRGLVRRLMRRFSDRDKVFRFGEGQKGRGVYEEPIWVVAGSLLPGLRAYHRRTGERRVGEVIRVMERRLNDLVRAGKPGLPTRYWVREGEILRVARAKTIPCGFMLLEGMSVGNLRRALQRGLVRDALAEVPVSGDVDIATSWSMIGRCWWLCR